ncbi:MAG: hypothetical protein WBM55_02590, partial [Muriicola sp.]
NRWMLPVARVVKGYSYFLNLFGKEGVIPEGMGAVTALKNTDFVDRFQKCKALTASKAKVFQEENKYLPPYWQLVRFAEASIVN